MIRIAVALLLGLALGIGGTLGAQALTDESGPDRSLEWRAAFARCVEEAQDGDDFLAGEDEEMLFGSDESPETATEPERAACIRRADRVLP